MAKLHKNGITIKPFGGLANRMRAIDSAYLLAQKINVPFEVIWEKSFELNCSFLKLFKPIENITLHEYHSGKLKKRISDRLVRSLWKTGIKLPRGFSKYLSDEEVLFLKRSHFSFEDLHKVLPVFISTVNRFYDGSDVLKIFQPIPELQTVIDRYRSSFGKHIMGIHIRRTDNIESVRYSPIQGFFEIMDAELIKNPETNFYLATDSPDDEKLMQSRYKGHIISHEKDLSRNSEKGIQDALIDLYCLSNTQKIIGSYFSSFSEVAAQIRNIELQLICSK